MPLTDTNREELQRDGFTVVRDVLSKEKTSEYYSRMWDWLESGSMGLKRGDRTTWKANYPVNIHGIIKNHQCPYYQYVIDLRSEEKIIDVFEQLWGTRELLTSQDSVNIMLPKPLEFSKKQTNSWLHTDQSGKKKGYQCVQGLLNLLECGPNDGGLVVIKGSHLRHEAYFKANPNYVESTDWHKLPNQKWQEIPEFADLELVKVCCHPGDLILWDSRLIHMAAYPQDPNAIRACVYVCMQPASLATKKDLEKKAKAFRELRVTSHYPCKVKLNSKTPRYYSVKDREHYESIVFPEPKPILTEVGEKIFGLKPYHS